MSRPAVPPPIQPPRPQHQPPAPKPVNMGLVAGMVIVAFAVTGLAIWAGIEQQKKPAGRGGQQDADRRKILADAGHDPDKKYPLWPLVIHNNYEPVEENGRVVIKGKISNHGEKNYEFVGVEFSLYDENDHVIGSASDRITGLRAGETWAYRAITYDKKWKTCKMVDITAW